MNDLLPLILQYGYVILFVVVCAEQIGLPIPAVPVLLGVGALAGTGQMSVGLALGVALAASLPPDVIWYELGRRRGGRVLGLLCRISLEPDSCVRRTASLFSRRGWKALVVAKFFPGLSTLAPPLAGIVGVPQPQFILLDSLGAIVWAGAWMGVGYVFSDALDFIASRVARFGNGLLGVVGGALAAYLAFKFIQRQRFLRSLRIARITPDELKRRLDSADSPLVIIDTRSPLDVHTTPLAVPGALWIPAEEVDRRRDELPHAGEIVLYCS